MDMDANIASCMCTINTVWKAGPSYRLAELLAAKCSSTPSTTSNRTIDTADPEDSTRCVPLINIPSCIVMAGFSPK